MKSFLKCQRGGFRDVRVQQVVVGLLESEFGNLDVHISKTYK